MQRAPGNPPSGRPFYRSKRHAQRKRLRTDCTRTRNLGPQTIIILDVSHCPSFPSRRAKRKQRSPFRSERLLSYRPARQITPYKLERVLKGRPRIATR